MDRQRRRGTTRLAVVFAQLDGRRRTATACTRSSCRSATSRRAGRPACAIEDDGHKMGLNGVDNGRLWFDGVRVPARSCSIGSPRSRATALRERRSRTPNRRFFTMLGTLVQGRVCVGGAGHQRRRRSRSRSRSATPCGGGSSSPTTTRPRSSCCWTTGMHQRRLFPLLARTYALHFAQEVVASQLHDVFSGHRRRRASVAARARVAGRRHEGARHLARHPHDPGVPRGVRRRGLPRRSTGSPR